jgi:hypothetical protein
VFIPDKHFDIKLGSLEKFENTIQAQAYFPSAPKSRKNVFGLRQVRAMLFKHFSLYYK